MKKVLLASSALALVGAFASPAAAAEWDVKVGGYMTQVVGYGDSDADVSGTSVDGDFDGVDVYSDSEVHFLPSITLDNGLKFGANIQLEGSTNGDQIDESYMFVRGSFGELLLGSENSAGYKMQYNAPNAGIVSINSGTMSAWIPFSFDAGQLFRGTLGTTSLENSTNNDAQRITYFTPRFAGFQVGASYARDALQDSSGPVDADTSLHDIFDIGANYVNSFGDFNVAVSGRWGTASAADASGAPDPDIWGAGINLGFAGFTVGGAYAKQNDAGASNGRAWDVGAAYETGPWGFSVEYFNGKNRGGPEDGSAELGNESLEQYLVSGAYALASGVSLGVFGAYVDFDDASGGEEDGSVDGFVIGTGISLSF
jgi:predicted porin